MAQEHGDDTNEAQNMHRQKYVITVRAENIS